MNGGQTVMGRGGVARRLVLAAVLMVLSVGGLGALIGPFVRTGETWEWRLTGEEDLVGAAVNADLLGIDARGALLTPQGSRAISVITPALELSRDANRVLTVDVARPDLAAGQAVETTVRLLWQTGPGEGYHFEPRTVLMSNQAGSIRFSLPVAPEAVHRIGVQFPGVSDCVLVASFALPRQGFAERLGFAWEEAGAHEPIGNHSVNFLRGPRMLGHAFNYYLVSAVLAACAAYAGVRVIQRRGVWQRGLAVIVFVVWALADGQATRNLARQTWAEVAALRGKTWQEQVELMSGPEIAWAYERLLADSPAGSGFAVVSDDDFAPSRRLAYLLAPGRVWRESWERAEFIVVMHAKEAVFDEPSGVFRWKSEPPIQVEKIATMSAEVYLLRVRSSATASPADHATARAPRPQGDEASRDREGAVSPRLSRPLKSYGDRSLTVAALFGGAGTDSERESGRRPR